MTDDSLTLLCLVDGLLSSRAFKIESLRHDLIKAKQTPAFDDITVDQLILWRVSVPPPEDDEELPILLNVLDEKKKLGLGTRLSKAISALTGSSAATFLERFVQGHEQLPLTTGSVPGLPIVWLRKQRERDDARPSLLFLHLPDPSTSSEPSKGLASDTILDLLGRCGPENVPIFGVSGCGKLRGMIELLSRQWGLYFNASGEDLGSDDMTTLLAQVGSRLEKGRNANNRYARTMTYLLLLSRLLILQFCLKVQNSSQSFTSAR
ncbi:hypothetical protein BG011_005276 [Mortierella polycephala]|uniref:Crinkler effector protein N-terminal domain-containing protein n=1 Tax=Mortierella polycephala TaxID=41804 RepID=A0A9P6PWI5_9FUNG|nr:hypothetical protein BG011_005276 [Mortierella polycephala]